MKIAITGGPGCGKTTLCNELARMGYHIVPEAATYHIKDRQSNEVKEPWLEEDFQQKILEYQLDWERKAEQKPGTVICDRGVPDGLAYTEKTSNTGVRIIFSSHWQRRWDKGYDLVFIVDPLAVTEQTDVRRENRQEALELCDKLERAYLDCGYAPIHIPAGTVKERLEMITKYLDEGMRKAV